MIVINYKKKILLVCDNRDSLNWGCRSTSIALAQILSRSALLETTPNQLASQPYRVPPLGIKKTKRKRLDALIRRTLQYRVAKTAYRLFGGLEDFVSINPEKTLKHFLRALKSGDDYLKQLKDKFEACDVIVINGEGSLIFRTPPRRDLNFQLFAVEYAHYLGKPVHYVNAMASDCPESGANPKVEESVRRTFQKCTTVRTRDPISQERLKLLGIDNVRWCPDALFSWRKHYDTLLNSPVYQRHSELFESWPESNRVLDFKSSWPESYIVVSGASRPPGINPNDWLSFYEKLIDRLSEAFDYDIILVDPSGDCFLQKLAIAKGLRFVLPNINIFMGAYLLSHAKAYISGRYHPSIMASLGGTPCTFLAANSHKTHSLQKVLNYPNCVVYDFNDTDSNIAEVVQHVAINLKNGNQLREDIKKVSHNNAIIVLNAYEDI